MNPNFSDDRLTAISNPDEVKGLRKIFGIENDFPAPNPEGGGVQFVGFENHPTHWSCFLYIGAPRESDDDAFCFFAFPKEKFSREQAEQTLKQVTSEFHVDLHPPFFDQEY